MKCSRECFAHFLQIGVIYTGPESKLSLSQNTFMLGKNQYESASIYVFASDSDTYVDRGGNRGYDKYFDDGKMTTYCNGIYINNEDECEPFADQPLNTLEPENVGLEDEIVGHAESGTTCKNTKGVFRNHLGDLKRCLWLLNDSRRILNCNGLTELGIMCRKSCEEDCSLPFPSSNQDDDDANIERKNRRKRKKEKIMKKRQREREEKLKAQESKISVTQPPSKVPTNKPTNTSSVFPTFDPTPLPMTPQPSKRVQVHSNTHDKSDIVFYVIGDAPYKVSELDPITGFPGQVRGIPNDAEFVVHVGDILSAKESECHVSWYQQVSYILRSSNAPVFITPGDNDWLGKYKSLAYLVKCQCKDCAVHV